MATNEVNPEVWAQRGVVRGYAGAEGFLEAGERALFERVAAAVQGQPILDLGVGGGRTVSMLAPLSSHYVALDYVPQMVDACHERFPDIDVQVGDARDLSRFADGEFGLVVFSFNGIDTIDHLGRGRVLREVRRVLRPGGLFWFSTLNMAGAGRRMSPWRPEWPKRDGSALRYALRTAHMLARIPKRVHNRAQIEPKFEQGEGWCIETLSAHDFRLLVHFTSLAAELRELAAHGFLPDPLVLDCSTGEQVNMDRALDEVFWFQILAQVPATEH